MFEYRNLTNRPFVDPFGWEDLFRNFDRFLREAEGDTALRSFGYAPVHIEEQDGRYVLTAELPGLSEKDVQVDLHEGVLTVTAERKVEPPQGYVPRRRERPTLRFARSYALGDTVDPDKTSAELKDGILTVTVAKAAGREKRNIAVKAA